MNDPLSEVAQALEAMRVELVEMRRELARLRQEVRAPGSPYQQQTLTFPSLAPPAEQLVTLDQIAAMVRRSKRGMEDHRAEMPAPRVAGRRGRAALWAWGEVRPWLEAYFEQQLPERFPSLTG